MKRISVLISLMLIAACLAGCGKDAAQAKARIDVAAAKLTVAPLDGLAKFATEQSEIAPVVDYESDVKTVDQQMPDEQISAQFFETPQEATYLYSTTKWGGRVLDSYKTAEGVNLRINRDTKQILFRMPSTQGLLEYDEKTALSDEVLQQKALSYVKETIPTFTYDDMKMEKMQFSCTFTFFQNFAGMNTKSLAFVILKYNGELELIYADDYGCMDGLREAEFDKAALDERLDAHMKERFSDCGMSYEVTDSYFTPDVQNERLLYYYRLTTTTWQKDSPDSKIKAPYEVYFDLGAIADFKAQ